MRAHSEDIGRRFGQEQGWPLAAEDRRLLRDTRLAKPALIPLTSERIDRRVAVEPGGAMGAWHFPPEHG